MNDIDKILMGNSKVEFLEQLTEELNNADKAIIVLIEDKEDDTYNRLVLTLGLNNTYEAYGILEVAKQDLEGEE